MVVVLVLLVCIFIVAPFPPPYFNIIFIFGNKVLLRRVLGGRPHLTLALNHIRLAKLLARPERGAMDEISTPGIGDDSRKRLTPAEEAVVR